MGGPGASRGMDTGMTTTSNAAVTPADLAPDWHATRGETWREHLSGMEATLAPIDAPLIDALGLDAPFRIADVGCGGGATSRAIVRRAPKGSVVRGYDLSPEVIAIARRRAAPESCDVSFDVADVGALLALFERAGFAELDVRAWRGQLPIGGALGPADAASFALAAFSSFDALLGRAGDCARLEARRRLAERFAEHDVEGSIRMNASVHIVTGVRASDTPDT